MRSWVTEPFGSLTPKASEEGRIMLIAIVGAGMAGLSCAAAVTASGHEAILFDKARGPGGRMSTRRMETPLGEVSFDHGAQYFTARDPAFVHQVNEWSRAGVVAPWPDAAEDAWVGAPAMNAVIKAMAAPFDVRWNVHIDRIEREATGWTLRAGASVFDGFDAVVLAVPAEQALPFLSLHDFDLARDAMQARSLPCWTGMFVFPEPVGDGQAVVRDHGAISWAARGNAKPGRSGPEGWVVQARPEWSQKHLESPAPHVAAQLLAELGSALGVDHLSAVTATAHRWRYAMNAGLRIGSLWNDQLRLGACGDWLMGPRVECAWLSGQQLANAIVQTSAVAA